MKGGLLLLILTIITVSCKSTKNDSAQGYIPPYKQGEHYQFDSGLQLTEHLYLKEDSTFFFNRIACWTGYYLYGKWYRNGDTIFLHSNVQPEDNQSKVEIDDIKVDKVTMAVGFHSYPGNILLLGPHQVIYFSENTQIIATDAHIASPGSITSIIKEQLPIDSVQFFYNDLEPVTFIPPNKQLPDKISVYFKKDPKYFKHFSNKPLLVYGDTLVLKDTSELWDVKEFIRTANQQ